MPTQRLSMRRIKQLLTVRFGAGASNAERQARHRARRVTQPAAVTARTRRPADRRSRPQRWRDAVADRWRDAVADRWRCRSSMPRGSRRCPTACATAPRPKRSKPSPLSTSHERLKETPGQVEAWTKCRDRPRPAASASRPSPCSSASLRSCSAWPHCLRDQAAGGLRTRRGAERRAACVEPPDIAQHGSR